MAFGPRMLMVRDGTIAEVQSTESLEPARLLDQEAVGHDDSRGLG